PPIVRRTSGTAARHGRSCENPLGTWLARRKLVDDWVTGIVESMGYAGIALLMALENVLPPIPSELIMPLAGYNAEQGHVNLWGAIAAGTFGTLVGTLPWYAAARWLERDRVYRWVEHHGHWLTVERKELERAVD